MRIQVTGHYGSDAVAVPAKDTIPVATELPVATETPVVWGEPVQGTELTAGEGVWDGSATISYAYQWESCQDRQYEATVLSDSPEGYWRLGDASASAADTSANANTGTYTGGVTRGVQGALLGSADTDRGARFDGVNDYVEVPDDGSLDLGDSFTIEEWVRRNASGIKGQIVQKGVNGYALRVDTDDLVYLAKADVADIAKSTIAIPADGNYHHVVATKSGATVKIYVDGEDVTDVLGNQTVSDTTEPLQIGRFYNQSTGGSAFYLDGDLDEVAVYDTALTAGQVTEHYEMGVSGCSDIGGATAATFEPTGSEVGERLRVTVTATNTDGSGRASSSTTASPIIASATDPVIAAGTLTDDAGNPVSGATVSLRLWPADLEDVDVNETPEQTVIDEATTDANGNYVLQTDVTTAIEDEAELNGGTVNFEIVAASGDMVYDEMFARTFTAPDTESIAAGGESLDGADEVWIDPDEALPDDSTLVALDEDEAGVYAVADPPNTPYEDECSNHEKTFKLWYKIGQGEDWIRVGELQSWLTMRAGFSYGTREHSSIEIGLKPFGRVWRAQGSVSLGTERNSERTVWTSGDGNRQRGVLAKFVFIREYQCGTGALRNKATRWNGMQMNIGGNVSTRNGECSKFGSNAVDMGPGTWAHDENKAVKWGIAGQLGPVNVGAQSGFSTRATSRWNFGSTFSSRVLCGISNPPIRAKRVFAGW